MKTYTKRILTWLMVIAMLTGIILTDYRAPVFSRAEEATVTQANTDGTSASSSTETGEQTGPQAEGTEGQTSPAATTQGAEAQMGEQGPEVANSPANQTVQEPQDITDFVDVKLEALDIIDHTEKTEYNYTMVDGKIVALKVTNKKEKPLVVTEYTMSADGKLLDADKNEFPGLLLNQWSRVNMKWGWGVTGDNMSHVKKGNYFKIPLLAHITNTGKHFDFRTPNGQKMGTFIVKNDFLTATFTEENDTYNMDELKNGFFKVSEEIYPVEEETEVPIEHQEEVILKLKIKKKPDSNGGNPGTPGPKPDYKPSETPPIFKKEGGQSNWHIRNGCVFFKFSVNHDKLIKMFETPDNVPVTKDVFLDDNEFPAGLAIDANSFEIKMPLHAAADSDVNKASNYILNNYWVYYQKAKDDKIKNSFIVIDKPQDLNDTNLQSQSSFRDYIKSEFKNYGGKPVIGVWDKRYLVIAFGDLPQSTIKYGDLRTNTDPNGPGETIAQTITRLEGDGKLTADQATKLRKVYAPDKTVVMFNIAFVADITDSNKTEFVNEAKLHWTTGEEKGNITLKNIQHQEGGVEGGLDYVNLKIVKQWVGKKKDSAKFKLIAKVEDQVIDELGESFTLDESNGWTKDFENKRAKHGVLHKKITYSIKEDELKGYNVDVKRETPEAGLILWTVTNIRKTVDIPVEKRWKDTDGSDLAIPEGTTVTVTLKQNDTVKATTILPKDNGSWKHIFEDLEEYDDDGNLYHYTVDEKPVKGFKKEITKDPANSKGWIITNTKAKINIPVTKKWEGLASGETAPEITVELFANEKTTKKTLILSQANGWKGEFKDLEINENGTPIKYTVKEKPIEGWYLSGSTGDAEHGFTLTNKKNPLIEIEVTKKWLRKDGTTELPKNHKKIPASIKVQLVNMTDNKNVGNEQEITAEKDWKHTFKNLPKFNATGTEIKYAVKEIGAPEGFASTVGGVTGGKAVIQNILAENPVTIKINKVWKDENGANLADDLKTRVVMQILHRLADGTYKLDVPVIEMNKDKGWSYTSNPLPEVDENGNKINYQVQEIEVPEGYRATSDVSADGLTFTITNTKIPRKSIKIEKKWVDENNNPLAADYEKMPNEITVRLYANGVSYKTVTLKKDADWKGQFDNLLTVDPSGDPIRYDVEELGFVDGFVPYKKVDQAKDIITITNKKTEEIVQLNISKKWVDVNNNPITDSNRLPDHISFKLFANGVSKGKLYVSKASGWNYTSGPLAKLDNKGKVINYTIEEDYVGGYTSTISKGADGYTFTATNKENPTPPGNPFIPPFIPDEPVPTPPNIPTPPAPNVPIDELVIEDDEVVLAGNDEEDLDDPEITDEPEDEEITDDLPRSNKDVPKTADFFMSGFANPLAVSTVIMMGYGLKKLVAKKKKD